MKTEICFTKVIVIANITFFGTASFLKPFAAKWVKYDPRQQNNDFSDFVREFPKEPAVK